MTALKIKPATATIDGRDYIMTVATVEKTVLGYEDHGIFSFTVNFAWDGAGQGLGYWSLLWSKKGAPDKDPLLRLKNVMDVVGANEWESMKGKKVFLLHPVGDPYGLIQGLVSIDSKRHFILREESA